MSILDALALSQATDYRARAAQLEAEARAVSDRDLAAELKSLAAGYIRLAEHAERHEVGVAQAFAWRPPALAQTDGRRRA